MKIATVSLKDIAGNKTMRMDAEFHVAVSEVKARAAELESTLTKEAVIEKLSSLKTKDMISLRPLTTGNKVPSRDDYIKAISNYPHIAYAMIEKSLIEIEASAAAEATESENYRETVKKLKL